MTEIREPAAVGPLVRVLGRDEAPFRILLDHVLGLIPGPEAAAALVNRLLAESATDVREGTLAELEPRTEPNIVPGFVRAAPFDQSPGCQPGGLGVVTTGAVAAVPKLVPALITTQYQMVMIPESTSPPRGRTRVGRGPDLHQRQLGRLPDAAGGRAGERGLWGNVDPGDSGSGHRAQRGQRRTPREPNPSFKMLSYSYRNVEVYEALVKMTGQDFGYDIPSWQRWVTKSFRPEPAPARQVPQP